MDRSDDTAAASAEALRPLEGKVALVTGAAAPSGIGRAIALRLAEDGAAVAVTDVGGALDVAGIVQEKSDLIAAHALAIEAAGGDAIALTLDVRSAQDVAAAMDALASQLGGLDILVNNAGSLAGTGPFLGSTPVEWQTSFEVNILGPTLLIQAAIPQMRRRGGGRIVNIGSTSSLGAHAGFGAYTVMKHATIGLTKTVAAEFGPEGILCNAVCPGFIATDMHMAANQRLAAEAGLTVDEMKTRRYASVALRDAGLPRDVANAVAYLAGPQAGYVTGTALTVAGGVPLGL